MNFWKPLALASMSLLVFVVGYQAANATPAALPQPTVQGAQPHMEAALKALQAAQTELQQAEHNKGGWRAAAAQATENAIKETRRGIAYADTH
jgi:hypothetical protein